MPPSRLSTVFDLSSLRLHTDGSLVQQTTKNTNLRSSKRTVRDMHGNWMAKDAGGLTSVPKYRKVLPIEREDEGKGSITEGHLDNAAPRVNFLEQQPTLKTSRARKRRKFATDEEYLAPMLPLHGSSALKHDPESILQPQLEHLSSDLLKCIHYYASMYYDERGLLLNVSREYRKERKARRLAKLAQDGRTARTKTRSSSDTGKFSGLEEDAIIIDDEDGEEESERDHQEEPTKAPVRRKDHDIADMYKSMDGSALIAIGMLLQEHINELLHPQTVSSAEL
ncbi:hypothetical protein EV368DRAFT_82250 [Lentinula lateritia]|nr:hypothetical protein EV368DRAFT_82250 [Lentinula lateritia]